MMNRTLSLGKKTVHRNSSYLSLNGSDGVVRLSEASSGLKKSFLDSKK